LFGKEDNEEEEEEEWDRHILVVVVEVPISGDGCGNSGDPTLLHSE
jgi:hypothetical protein